MTMRASRIGSMAIILATLIIASAFTSLTIAKILSEMLFPTEIPEPEFPSTEPIPPLEKRRPPLLTEFPQNEFSSTVNKLYDISPYLALSSWISFLLLLIWKGHVRRIWRSRGYDYDVFKLLVKTRGSPTRVRILKRLSIPMNRLQLARELELQWRAIDSHISTLINHNLVKEVITFGTAEYLMITDKGKEVLELLENSKTDSI